MSLLNFDEKNREPFVLMVSTLIERHGQSPRDLFVHALESRAEAEMNYWTVRALVEDHDVDPTAPVAEDAAGESVLPLHAAVLMDNPGALAALLELGAYTGGMTDRDIQLAARMAGREEKEALLALLMKHAENQGALESFMRALHDAPLH